MQHREPILAPGDPWSGYASTIVEVVRPGGDNLLVAAAPPGDVGVWPWTAGSTVYVLTAWDPAGQRFSLSANRARQAELEDDLRPTGSRLWKTRGFNPDTGYRDEGVAVTGLPEADVMAVGARFEQDSVFAWTVDEWAIVACSGYRRLSLGWRVAPAPVGP